MILLSHGKIFIHTLSNVANLALFLSNSITQNIFIGTQKVKKKGEKEKKNKNKI